MMYRNAVTYVHHILRSVVQPGDVVVDATVGNGYDTLALAALVGEQGTVFGFDVQQQALDRARERLLEVKATVHLLHQGHESMSDTVASHAGRVRAVTFNLGYLPGGDKAVTTTVSTTLQALEQAFFLLAANGVITIVCYTHPEGLAEYDAIRTALAARSQEHYTCTEVTFINQQGSPPTVFVVQSIPGEPSENR